MFGEKAVSVFVRGSSVIRGGKGQKVRDRTWSMKSSKLGREITP